MEQVNSCEECHTSLIPGVSFDSISGHLDRGEELLTRPVQVHGQLDGFFCLLSSSLSALGLLALLIQSISANPPQVDGGQIGRQLVGQLDSLVFCIVLSTFNGQTTQYESSVIAQ